MGKLNVSRCQTWVRVGYVWEVSRLSLDVEYGYKTWGQGTGRQEVWGKGICRLKTGECHVLSLRGDSLRHSLLHVLVPRPRLGARA